MTSWTTGNAFGWSNISQYSEQSACIKVSSACFCIVLHFVNKHINGNMCSASQSGSGSPNVMGGGQVTALGSYTPLTLGLITTSMWKGKRDYLIQCGRQWQKFCIRKDMQTDCHFISTRLKYFFCSKSHSTSIWSQFPSLTEAPNAKFSIPAQSWYQIRRTKSCQSPMMMKSRMIYLKHNQTLFFENSFANANIIMLCQLTQGNFAHHKYLFTIDYERWNQFHQC